MMEKELKANQPTAEHEFGKGAIRTSYIKRKWNKLTRRKKLGKTSTSIDWNTPFDVEDKIGQLKTKNQGGNYSCSGQSGSYFLQSQRLLQGLTDGELSAKSIYAPIAYPGGGTMVNDLLQQICTSGANLEASVPSYDAYGNPLTEQMITEKSWMTPDTTKDALTRTGYTPCDLPEDIDAIAQAVRDYGGAFLEIAGQNGNTPSWLDPMPSMPQKSNPNQLWYHFLWVKGYRMYNGKKCLVVRNSWGDKVGIGGVQFISEDYMPYIEDAFTAIYDTQLVPDSNNHSIWAELLRYFRLVVFKMK